MIKTSKILSEMHMSDDDIGEVCIEENIEYTKQVDLFEKTGNMYVGGIQICRCAANTGQLCALDVTKNSNIREYLLTCRNFTKHIRKQSNGYRNFF